MSVLNKKFISDLNYKFNRISKVTKDIKEDVWVKAFSFINDVNSLDEMETAINGRDLSNVMIPPLFAKFVLPCKVTVDISNRLSLDILDHGDIKFEGKVSYAEFILCCEEIYGAMKETLPLGSSVSELRKPKNMADVLSVSSYHGRCNWDGKNVFIPIPLTFKSYRDIYYNTPNEDVLNEWVLQLIHQF